MGYSLSTKDAFFIQISSLASAIIIMTLTGWGTFWSSVLFAVFYTLMMYAIGLLVMWYGTHRRKSVSSKVDPTVLNAVLIELEKEGLVESFMRDGVEYWQLTEKGRENASSLTALLAMGAVEEGTPEEAW